MRSASAPSSIAPAQANRTLDLARWARRWGVGRGLIPVEAPYPFLALRKPHRGRPRERWYGPDEIRALWAVLEAERPLYRGWARLMWWTGARPSEVAEMRWEELDAETGRWVKTKTKTKGHRPLVLTLPRQARELLEVRRAASGGDQALGFVLPSPRSPRQGLSHGSRSGSAMSSPATATTT